MARGRMINKRLGKSEKFAKLKSDRSRLLYVLIYINTDCEGRFEGDPKEIKIECCPYLRYSTQKIAESIIDLTDVGLINLYEVNEKPYIQFVGFDRNQPGLRKDRESPSSVPNPDECGSNSGATPSLYLRLKLRLKESKLKEEEEEISFDANKCSFENIQEKDIAVWKDAYPACDINQEFKKMIAWLLGDWPKRRKINWKRFIQNWLSRQQDGGGTKNRKGETTGIDAIKKKVSRGERLTKAEREEYNQLGLQGKV